MSVSTRLRTTILLASCTVLGFGGVARALDVYIEEPAATAVWTIGTSELVDLTVRSCDPYPLCQGLTVDVNLLYGSGQSSFLTFFYLGSGPNRLPVLVPSISPGACKVSFRILDGETEVRYLESATFAVVAPPLQLDCPLATSGAWPIGSTMTIRWSGGDPNAVMAIELSGNNGTTWSSLIPPNTPAPACVTGSWDWVVTEPATQQARIRVTCAGSTDQSGPVNLYGAPYGLTCTVIPEGRILAWQSSAPTGTNYLVSYRCGGPNWISLGSTTAKQLTIDCEQASCIGSAAIFTVTASRPSGCQGNPAILTTASLEVEAIEPCEGAPCFLDVLQPNGAESFSIGSTVGIRFAITPPCDSYYSISLSRDSGTTWDFLADACCLEDITHPWTVDGPPSSTCLIRVESWGGAFSDVSDAVFEIRNATTAWRLETLDPAADVGRRVCLAIDGNMWAHAAYWDMVNTRIQYVVRGDGGTITISETAVDLALPNPALAPDLGMAVDFGGRPHVVYWDSGSYTVRYVTRENESWGPPESLGSTDAGGGHESIAIDGRGVPHVVFLNSEGDLVYATKPGVSWSFNVAAAGADLASATAVVVDAAGNPRIAYADDTGLHFVERVSGNWSAPTPIDTGPGAYEIGIALDSFGNPHLSYQNSSTTDLKYATRVGGTWVTSVVATTGVVGRYNDLAIDRFDVPHIAYSDETNSKVWHTCKSGGFWGDEDLGAAAGLPMGLAIGADVAGNPAIAYCSPERHLKFAFSGGTGVASPLLSTCTFEVVQNPTKALCLTKYRPIVARFCPGIDEIADFDVVTASVAAVGLESGTAIPGLLIQATETSHVVNIAENGATTDVTDGLGQGQVTISRASGYGHIGICVGGVVIREIEARSPDCAKSSLPAQCGELSTNTTSFVSGADVNNPSCGFLANQGPVVMGINNWWDLGCDLFVSGSDVTGLLGKGGVVQHNGHGDYLGEKNACGAVGASARGPQDGSAFDAGEPAVDAPVTAPTRSIEVVVSTLESGARIGLLLESESSLQVVIFDTSGRRVREFDQARYPKGWTFVTWDGRTDRDNAAPSGVYFVRVYPDVAGGRKLVLIR